MTDTSEPEAGDLEVYRLQPAARGERQSDGTWRTETLQAPYTWRVMRWTGTRWQPFGRKYPTEEAATRSRENKLGTTQWATLDAAGLVLRFRSGVNVQASWTELAIAAGGLGLATCIAWRWGHHLGA